MANILLVDDQPYMGEFLSEEIGDMGHTLRWIGDADCLILEIEELNPDLILLDLYFDGFDGWRLLDAIKRHDGRIPVIILTAYDSFSNDPRLSHAQGYVIKDFDTGRLKEKITEVLDSQGQGVSQERSLFAG